MASKLPIILGALLLAVGGALLLSFLVLGAPNDYAIAWWTVDGGGDLSQGGEYTLQGTAGQPEAGPSQGEEYSLAGGFWAGIVNWVWQFFTHLPLVLR